MNAEPISATLLPCRLAITLETLQMAGASPWLGWTTALAADHVQLVLSRRFEPGTPVSLGIDDGSGSPHTCLARIATLEAADHGWLLTCRLIRPLDPQELDGLLQSQPAATKSPPDTVPEITRGEGSRTHVDLAAIRARLGRLGKP